jgi:hypothetical protein
VRALTAARAARAFDSNVEAFERLGYRPLERPSAFVAPLGAPRGGSDLVLRMSREGRVFGGNWALEVTTAEPVFPQTVRGLRARGRGVVRMQGVRFRAAARADGGALEIAQALSEDAQLGEALGRVHFERLSVDPSGRPVIRHLGGSLVWVIFPPIVRATPLPPGQPKAMVEALDAFAAAGERVGVQPAPPSWPSNGDSN